MSPVRTPTAERRFLAAALALLVHLLFLGLMVFAISWQTRPASVVAEIWDALPGPETPPPPAPKPQLPPEPSRPVQPPPQPTPKKALEPPRAPQAKPASEPVAKPLPATPADIALEKKKLQEDKRLEEAEARHRRELADAARREDELRREAEAVKATEQQRQRDQAAAQAAAAEQQRQSAQQAAQTAAEQQRQQIAQQARARAIDIYRAQIMAAVRARLVEPPGVQGNPQAEVKVLQLPTGDVAAVKVTRSSGLPAVDEAFERAVLAASPLPLPADRGLFSRELILQFRLRE